ACASRGLQAPPRSGPGTTHRLSTSGNAPTMLVRAFTSACKRLTNACKLEAVEDNNGSRQQTLPDVGTYIREQRRKAQLSLRKLAERAGVSNPYLSQIERGLRQPSAKILKGIATALQVSAETIFTQAGI